jgi:HSP20 family protein
MTTGGSTTETSSISAPSMLASSAAGVRISHDTAEPVRPRRSAARPPAQPIFARPTTGQVTQWAPRMDVYEKDNTFFVKAELPGVKKEDIQVELDHGTLTIRGQLKAETEVKEAAYFRMERTYGTYYRHVPEQVHATVTDGVLEIRIPKPTEKKPEAKKISVG